jgi:hypothetical protein
LITARRAGATRFCGRSGECEKAARCIVLSACLAREVGIPGTGHYIHEEQPRDCPRPGAVPRLNALLSTAQATQPRNRTT